MLDGNGPRVLETFAFDLNGNENNVKEQETISYFSRLDSFFVFIERVLLPTRGRSAIIRHRRL